MDAGLTKGQRLAEIFRRLSAARPVATHDDAYRLLCETIDAVEDELTAIPNDPANHLDDNRIYPPQGDYCFAVGRRPDLKRYESKRHDTFIRDNGAITTVTKGVKVAIFEKPGADGRGTEWESRP